MLLTGTSALVRGWRRAERWSARETLRGDEHGRGFIFLTKRKTSQQEI